MPDLIMKTILEVLKLSTQHLSDRGVENSRREAEELLSDVLGVPRLNLYMEYDRPLTEVELERCRDHLQRRAKGEPAPYIRGNVTFYGCRIEVSPDVLIPRQETEILVDKIASQLAAYRFQRKKAVGPLLRFRMHRDCFKKEISGIGCHPCRPLLRSPCRRQTECQPQ